MADLYRIVGAGGHAKVVIASLLSSGHGVVACYDDDTKLLGFHPVPGVSVEGPTDRLSADQRDGELIILAVGDNATRRRLSLRWSKGYGIAVAPSAVIGMGVSLGEGTMVLPSATVNVGSAIGRHVILNTSCSVDHDCRIEDFAHIAPGCCLGGNVLVCEGAFVGLGSRIVPGVRIGRWSIVGAGAVVTKDVPEDCTVVGVPARIVKTRQPGWESG